MEQETACANDEVTDESDEKYVIVAIFHTTDDAFEGQVHE